MTRSSILFGPNLRAASCALVAGLFSALAHGGALPYCGEFATDKAPNEAVLAVSVGVVSPGAAVSLTIQPGTTCSADQRDRNVCHSPVRGGTQGLELLRAPGWVCVAVPGRQPLDVLVAWLPQSRWSPLPVTESVDLSDWTGVWQNDHARLNIAVRENRVFVDGHAIWQGRADPHFGNLNFDGVPVAGVLTLPGDQDQCELALRRVGKFIFAQDNGYCGGANVRFSGMYRYRAGL